VVSFSVVIVTHGREDLLMKCLDSLQPGIENWQLIIFWNGVRLLIVIEIIQRIPVESEAHELFDWILRRLVKPIRLHIRMMETSLFILSKS
jgi:hypothetical protein